MESSEKEEKVNLNETVREKRRDVQNRPVPRVQTRKNIEPCFPDTATNVMESFTLG